MEIDKFQGLKKERRLEVRLSDFVHEYCDFIMCGDK